MSTSTIAVNGQTAIYPSGNGTPLLVFNTGTTNVYVGSISGLVAGANTTAIAPGSSVQWNANTPLYATIDPGNTGTLEVSTDVNAVFDAHGIANQIIAQGLAGDIAQQISVNGAPSIDAPIESGLISQTYQTQQPSNAVGQLFTGQPLMANPVQCSKYQTLFVQLWEARSSANTPARSCLVRWFDSTGTIVLDHDIVSCFPYSSSNTFQDWYTTTAVLPIKSTLFDIVPIVNSYDTTASPQATVRLRYSLSYRVQSKRIVYGNPLTTIAPTPTTATGYNDPTVFGGLTIAQYSSGTLAASTNYSVPLAGVVGRALLTVGTGTSLASGQNISFSVQDNARGTSFQILSIKGPTTAATILTQEIIIPPTPLLLYISVGTPTMQVQWSLSSQNS